MKKIISEIKDLAKKVGQVKIMEVCGGHTHTIVKNGLRDILPASIQLISGPGCPVCVSSQHDIDSMIKLAQSGVKIATYGDMLRVPGSNGTLAEAKAEGADIKMIYSVSELENDCDRVFFGIGFETTSPMTARLLDMGIIVYSSHKLIPPAMELLVADMAIDAFIDPGHVSTIIGEQAWHKLKLGVPQVIAGFEAEDILEAVKLILEMINQDKAKVINNYESIVTKTGNSIAQQLIAKTMRVVDAEWRGLGVISNSGLEPIDDKLNAKLIYSDLLKDVKTSLNTGCQCHKVVRGLIEPSACLLFKKVCTPENPQGACMVSMQEGACAIAYQYGRSLARKNENN